MRNDPDQITNLASDSQHAAKLEAMAEGLSAKSKKIGAK